MSSLAIPSDYGYCIMVVGLSGIVNIFGSYKVVSARKRYNVKYPNLYAPEGHAHANEFNCVQRSHQNTLETMPLVNVCVAMGGFVYPKAFAVCGAIWCFGRFLYIYDYSRGNPASRVTGAVISRLGDFPIVFMMFYAGAKLLGYV